MTNYEILQHLKYIKLTIDMLIDRIPLDDSTQKMSSSKTDNDISLLTYSFKKGLSSSSDTISNVVNVLLSLEFTYKLCLR